jgi:hypothetical protein
MKDKMAVSLGILLLLLATLISSCGRQKTVCPPPVSTPSPKPELAVLINLPSPQDASTQPVAVEIGGRRMTVDKLVDYPLCNDNWSGTVYVSCDAQVAQAEKDAEDNPLFLKGCSLNIAPNTVVYVAAHNDAAYYKGCSCHTGEDPIK